MTAKGVVPPVWIIGLIRFAAAIIEAVEQLPVTYAGKHLGGQLLRSGTAPALLYGEAQSAESPADFIHKLKLALKELRESMVCLKIIELRDYLPPEDLSTLKQECHELTAILFSSCRTAQSNRTRKSRN